jgi:hypothetical protein
MSEIDLPDTKRLLWTEMRADLVKYVPWFADNELLLCPICCRALKFEQFSLEHVIPQQAVNSDPLEVRQAISKGQRSGLTLLCKETIIVDGKSFPNGCNGWKGRHFDKKIGETLRLGGMPRHFSNVHLIAFLMVGYLGLFLRYGYRVALVESGLVLRNQFFNPTRFTKQMPTTSQMVLCGEPIKSLDSTSHSYWSDPVKIVVTGRKATIVIRNYSVMLTLSEDPNIPLAIHLAYVPRRHAFRADLRLAFT